MNPQKKFLIYLFLPLMMVSQFATATLLLDRAIYDVSNDQLDLAFTISGTDVIDANAGFAFDIDGPLPINLFSTTFTDISILSASVAGFTINSTDTGQGDSVGFAYTGAQLADLQLAFIIDTGAAGFTVNSQVIDFALNLTFITGSRANLSTPDNTHTAVGVITAGSVSAVPIPASIWLLSCGLIGLLVMRKKCGKLG